MTNQETELDIIQNYMDAYITKISLKIVSTVKIYVKGGQISDIW